MDEMTLRVKEATDRTAIQNLENALLSLDGIERALVDTGDGEVKITYNNDKISRMEVEEIIQQNGLNVQ
ncbi:heavy-metal-associated domain-containing protein [Rossellomorea vietnamensis]|uniref:Heavy-metal-associated domain-containing protein n=1 Tax=Rossellomorea vietnamensis TaxID=218284 RepID=A0A5D4NLI2_9BACI|nr:heavy metal-associated domain-containing protein [Rossellomorea vietnamensis]TYS14977.1 heavy-metal-associated domain-containing protein [Rossellomorea vietnamensis]